MAAARVPLMSSDPTPQLQQPRDLPPPPWPPSQHPGKPVINPWLITPIT